MHRLLAVLIALLPGALTAQAADTIAPRVTLGLMPVPESLSVQAGRLPLDSTFRVAVPRIRDGRLLRGVQRAVHRLSLRTGLRLAGETPRDTAGATLIVDVRSAGQAVETVGEDESYHLDVTPTRVLLRAPTVVGALRGLETFLQLVAADSATYYLPQVRIADRPRFPWRGLLIDVSRHFEPVAVIERNLDAMAAVKLNVLHWHLSDDQGFRVESHRFPRLQEYGSDGQYYTQAQIREVVSYARDRGIRVVPEFDMPGHATSWFAGYPRLASAPGPYPVAHDYGVLYGTFDPTREAVYTLIDGFVGEMARLFPDPYWHIGGDEVNGRQWDENRAIRRFMRRHHLADKDALQAYFNRRLVRILTRHHKRAVGWDEILTSGLPRTVVVQSWRGEESLGAGAKDGYAGILSAGYYLDAMSTAAQHYAVDPLPAGSDLDAAQAARILGGEACMWAELVDPETIDSRIWPRTAAIAERLWSPRSVVDANDMYRRLASVSVELEDLGLHHISAADRLWRRIAGTDAIGPLRALARIAEPVPLGVRMRARRPSTLTPLQHPGDFVTPDSREARQLSARLDTLLGDGGQHQAIRDSLRSEFRRWRELAPAISDMRVHAPLLADADSAAAVLARIGAFGEQALAFLNGAGTPPPGWTGATLAALDSAGAPHGLLRLPVIFPLRRLVLAAGQQSSATGR